ncbi:hypothetical protein V1T75_10370 [Tenacibaculum sp. FZY0031]|uniref:hypothetical protein n=1 Tax=Tenacibaculum sp. FZY0031 TaxID=3116648 RepID=UPI002EC1A7F3|nr:hypothetical protein [Tenacibaculum sp. FZY0031]
MKESKLLYAIEQFIALNETERELFLKVIENPSGIILPPEFTEEDFYNKPTKNQHLT